MSAAQARSLRALAAPIVSLHECDLEDVVIRQAGKRRLVRVVVDHAGGLSMDLVAAISKDISRALDDSSALGESAYVLEVTSPGVDRPLTEPRHWERNVGRMVAVTLREGGEVTGRISTVDADGVGLDVAGKPVAVQFADVARAVVVVEFHHVDAADLDPDDPDDADDPEDPRDGQR